jgi:hypothetical protein
MVIAAQALMAVHTASSVPTYTYTLAYLHSLRIRACRDHCSNDFMPWHNRIPRNSPVIVENRKIGMAEAAVFNCNFHLLIAERAGFVNERFKSLACTSCCPTADLCHDRSPSKVISNDTPLPPSTGMRKE